MTMHLFSLESDGLFSFARVPASYNTRELRIGAEPIFTTGPGCGTCQDFFSRIPGVRTPWSADRLSDSLAGSLALVPPALIETVKPLLPRGRYLVGLLRLCPILHTGRSSGEAAEDGDVAQTDCSYHWTGRSSTREVALTELGGGREWIENFVEYETILPHRRWDSIDQERVAYYRERIWGGMRPTALALSIVERRHWHGDHSITQLTHFLIDGHHKMLAAENMGLQLLTFLNLSESDACLDEYSLRRISEYSLRRQTAVEIERGSLAHGPYSGSALDEEAPQKKPGKLRRR